MQRYYQKCCSYNLPSIITAITFLDHLFILHLAIEIFSHHLHHLKILVLLLDLLLDFDALPDRHLQGQRNDQSVHFIEFRVVWAVDHAVSEDFHPLFEIVEKCIINYSLVTKLKDYYNRKNSMWRISS